MSATKKNKKKEASYTTDEMERYFNSLLKSQSDLAKEIMEVISRIGGKTSQPDGSEVRAGLSQVVGV